MLFLIFLSCSQEYQDTTVEPKDAQNIEGSFSLDKKAFSNIRFDKELEFKSKDELKDYFNNVYLFTEKDELSEEGYLGMNLDVSYTNDKIILRQYPVFDDGIEAKGLSSCPDGMSRDITCFTFGCVTDRLEIYRNIMSPGDSFSVHYHSYGAVLCINGSLQQAL